MSRLVPIGQLFIVDPEEIDFDTMFDFSAPDEAKIFNNLEGLNSGVPTRTTATITPTTLRNIEQTIVELQCRTDIHTSQAGFVPPPVTLNNFVVHQGSSQTQPEQLLPMNSALAGSSASSVTYGTDSSSAGSPAARSSAVTPPPVSKRRNMGGRRPAKAAQNLSPEEEERRKVRRERNKMAAARCRKRRLDHTNELIEETAGLERKKQILQAEIRQLQLDREELELILRTHRACCRMQSTQRPMSPPDIKPAFQSILAGESIKRPPSGPIIYHGNVDDDEVRVKVEVLDQVDNIMSLDNDIIFTSPQTTKRLMLSSANLQVVTSSSGDLNTPTHMSKPNRPSFLDVPMGLTPAQAHGLKANPGSSVEVAGVAITTPSNGIPFNFESLMEGGTGLTPVQPCSSQQHRVQPEILSPDSVGPPKLVML